MKLEFKLNGISKRIDVGGGATLLDVLRDDLGSIGTKEGCGEGECGACTVLVEGVPIDSCIRAAMAVDGCSITTVEGLADGEDLSPLQAAFVANGAVQCGFCTPGLLMTLTALREAEPNPDSEQVKQAIAGNVCRCTGYSQIVEATLSLNHYEGASS